MKIPKIKIDGVFYHGTMIDPEEGIFSEFNADYSEYPAIWFTSDLSVAKEFSEWKDLEGYINVVYQIKVQSNKIAKISYELGKELDFYFGLNDPRDLIPILIEKGYEGWRAKGSINGTTYDDYAIFNSDKIEILGISILSDKDWTDFIPLNKAKQILSLYER